MTYIQTHRFGDLVAIYVGKGETVYFTAKEAAKFAAAINKAVKDVRNTPDFSKSQLSTFTMSVNGTTYQRG